MRKSIYSGLLLFFSLVMSNPVLAQQCPGNATILSNTMFHLAYVSSNPGGTMGPLYDFIGIGCSSTAFGTMAPTQCNSVKTTTTARLTAQFANAISNTTMNGCIFNCQGGTCRVRGGDALPVELMDFEINEEDTKDG